MANVIYADNAATTKVSEKVLAKMLPYFSEKYGNPSSFLYSLGSETGNAISEARLEVAKVLNCDASEIYFTSGGSESNNWALKGAALEKKLKQNKNHIITTNIEHHSVLHTVEFLKKQNFDITFVQTQKNGIINPKDIENAICEKTALVSIMYANNEIGTIQPIPEIGKICKEKNVLFHTDAVQAIGSLKIDVAAENIDLLSLSAHKFYGPKGVGALFAKKNVSLQNLIHGGMQERGKRASTENVAGIVGLGEAIKIAYQNLEQKNSKLISMRNKIIENFLKIPNSRLNGDKICRLPNNINVCFEGIEGESLIVKLSRESGVCASSGSACTSGSLDPSHVLLALGLPHEIAHGSLRISIGIYNTEKEIEIIIKKVPEIVAYLRKYSPMWEKTKKLKSY
jgi:cysteine desulfurase